MLRVTRADHLLILILLVLILLILIRHPHRGDRRHSQLEARLDGELARRRLPPSPPSVANTKLAADGSHYLLINLLGAKRPAIYRASHASVSQPIGSDGVLEIRWKDP